MRHPASVLQPRSEASGLALGLAIGLLGVAFFLTEHDLNKSRREAFSLTAEELEIRVETGNLQRQLGFLMVGFVGLSFLAGRGARPLRFRDPLAWLVLAYLAWCAASVAWSVNPALAAKRVVVLGLCFLGALGLARRLSPRQLCLVAMTILAAYGLLGVGVEIALGTFRPWAADYRFSGTVHPNTQGTYCAALCLAAAATAGGSTRRTLAAVALFALGLALLLLTRSRTATAGLAVALAAVVALRLPPRARLLAGIGGLWVVCATVLVCFLWGADPEDQLADAVLLGRTEKAGSLSGRVPLWSELLTYVQARPLAGYGYDSFWTPEHIEDISETLQWAIHTAHSVYLETVLSVGLIGGVLLLLAVVLGTCRLVAEGLATGQHGYSFLVGLIVFGAASGFLESGFVQPMFVPLVAACGVVHAAFCQKESTIG